MAYWTVPKIWPGSTVFILGGGPSLEKENLEPIHNHRVIGVNNSYQLGDWVDVCWFGDCRWYDQHKETLSKFAGLKVHCCNRSAPRPGTKRISRGKPRGIDDRPNFIAWNHSSGASAINLAVHFGARRIILLGFDMKLGENRRNNWHDQHPQRPKNWNPYERFLKPFPDIKRDADKMGIEIINATQDSALTLFPMKKLDELI